MNNKNYLIGGIIALVVILVGYYLIKGQGKTYDNTQNQAVNTQSTDQLLPTTAAKTNGQVKAGATVDYTDSGFSPKSITVKVGDTVTWTNKSGGPIWIASNPHPTHTDLPGFDELGSAKNGETYSYTFAKAGSWKYHNHMNAVDGGVVIVQ